MMVGKSVFTLIEEIGKPKASDIAISEPVEHLNTKFSVSCSVERINVKNPMLKVGLSDMIKTFFIITAQQILQWR